MPIIAYREQRFNRKSEVVVQQAISIIEDMRAQGYVLTLRQLYYQFVSRNWLENTEQSYKRLGSIVSDAREVGRIDWNDIEDRGRAAILQGHVPSPEDVLKGIEHALRLDPWLEQDVYVETFVEKSALEGVVARPCERWRAPYMACKGYLSTSEAWRAGRRFERAIERGKRPVLIHLGDHDPSGLQMTEDNDTRLALFARQGVEVRRIALNMDQVQQYSLPENPAKTTDSRSTGYIAKHGPHSWELDALLPKVIDDLIDAELRSLIDHDRWAATLQREKDEREPLRLLGLRWDEVKELALCDEVHPMRRLRAMDEAAFQVRGTVRSYAPVQLEVLNAAMAKKPYVRPPVAANEDDAYDEVDDLYDVADPLDPTVED
jgi:hypothetical protein